MGLPQKIMCAHCAVIRPDHFKFASYGPALPIGRAHSQVEEYIASPTSTPYVSKQLVSQASHLSLYFLWEEQNTSAHCGQLSMPQRNVVIAFNSCRSHCQTVTTDRAFRTITLGTYCKELSQECTRSVISPTS